MATTMIQQQFSVFLLPLSYEGGKLQKIRLSIFRAAETNAAF